MSKVLIILGATILSVGGFMHHHYWQAHSESLKHHIQELAQKNENQHFKITYDEIETAGYPFRSEVVMKNPCFYFLKNNSLHLVEGCLKGTMVLGYRPHSLEKKVFIETDGDLLLKLPGEKAGETQAITVNGQLKQDYHFDDSFDFVKASDFWYSVQHLQNAELKGKNLSIASHDAQATEIIKNLSGSLEYRRKSEGKDSQSIYLSADYEAFFGDMLPKDSPPLFGHIVDALNTELTDFSRQAGSNQGRYFISLTISKDAMLNRVSQALHSLDFDQLPPFSLKAEHLNKNNLATFKSEMNAEWEKESEHSYAFKMKNKTIQDLSKEGVKQYSALLQALAWEGIKLLSAETSHNPTTSFMQPADFAEFSQGFPSHLDVQANILLQKSDFAGKEGITVTVDPIQLQTEKGGIRFDVDHTPHEPFIAKIEFDQFIRVMEALIVKYNMVAKLVDGGKGLPQLTAKEKERLLAILQKYSDNPEELSKKVSFTITQASNGSFVLGSQDIRALVAEMAFFLHHLQDKL